MARHMNGFQNFRRQRTAGEPALERRFHGGGAGDEKLARFRRFRRRRGFGFRVGKGSSWNLPKILC